jgi:hypothetical protein
MGPPILRAIFRPPIRVDARRSYGCEAAWSTSIRFINACFRVEAAIRCFAQ